MIIKNNNLKSDNEKSILSNNKKNSINSLTNDNLNSNNKIKVSESFGTILDTEQKKYTILEIKNMIEDLENLVRKLQTTFSPNILMEYKTKVKTILEYICNNLYKIQCYEKYNKQTGKISWLVSAAEKINKELIELDELFRQKANVNIWAKHLEIKGLLLDMLL